MSKPQGMREIWRGSNISIGVDENNVTVSEIGVAGEGKHTGEEVLSKTKYYSRLDAALVATARRVAKRDADSLRDYVRIMHDIENEIRRAVDPVRR